MDIKEVLTLNKFIRNIDVGAGGLIFVKLSDGSVLKPFGKKEGCKDLVTIGDFIKRTELEIEEGGYGFLMGTLYKTPDQETTTEVAAINVVNGSFGE